MDLRSRLGAHFHLLCCHLPSLRHLPKEVSTCCRFRVGDRLHVIGGGGGGGGGGSIGYGDYNVGGGGYGLPSPSGSSLTKDFGFNRQSNLGKGGVGGSSFSNTINNFPSDDSYHSGNNDIKSSQSVPTLPLTSSSFYNNNNNSNSNANLGGGGGGGGGGGYGDNNNYSSNLAISSDLSSQITRSGAQFQSPGRSNNNNSSNNANNNAGAASPAVDRVSAALALKLAQQTRSFAPLGGGGGGGSNLGSDSRSIGSNNNPSSSLASLSGSVLGGGGVGGGVGGAGNMNRFNSRPTSSSIYGGGNNQPSFNNPRNQPYGGSYNDDILAADYDNTSATSDVGYSSVYPSNYMAPNNSNNNASNSSMYESSTTGTSNAVEESIKRAQEKINRKLAKIDSSHKLTAIVKEDSNSNISSNALNAVHSTPTAAANNGNGANKTPNSGRSISKLHDTVQQARTLYPASPSQSFEKNNGGEDGYLSRLAAADDNHSMLSAPNVRPMSPPDPNSLQFDYSSAKLDDYLSGKGDGVGGGAGAAGGGKKKKKTKKSSAASDKSNSSSNLLGGIIDPNTGGVLPKISK